MRLQRLFLQGGILSLLVCALAAPAATEESGKITGVITDKRNGEPLLGANITLVGTTLGASTDEQGEYLILRVPPGTYTLRASLLGFRESVIRNVHVSVGLTTRITIEMTEQTVDLGEEVVVIAERPIIQKDVTSSTQYLSATEMAELPVSSAKEGVMIQTGVFLDPIPILGGLGGSGRGEARYAIRGGTQDQIKWFIDGVRTAALIEGRADRGGSFTNVNMNAVQELQVVTGGFNPEYGEAQSGIVNVVMREGGEKFSGSLEYMYGIPGQHHFGSYLYDRAAQKEFLDHTLPDGSLDTAWWTPYRQEQIYDYTAIPDHIATMSLGGPLFQTSDIRASFFLSGGLKREAYSVPRPRDSRQNENIMANITLQLQPAMRIRFNALYDHEAHSTLQETGDFVQQAKFYRGWGSLLDTYTTSLSGQMSHTLTPSVFYDVKLSWYLFESKEGPSDYTQLGKSSNPDIFGYQRYNGYPNEPFDAWAFVMKNHLRTGDVSFTGSLNWQADASNFIKAGVEFRYNTLQEVEALRFPSFTVDPSLWINRGLHETFHPLQFSVYVQDKMEFESMILNVGVRYDYFNPNRDWFYGNPYFNLSIDPGFNAALDPDRDQVDSLGRVKYSFGNVLAQPRSASPTYHMVSPRFGVSFPITDNSVLHFNYGHFYQMPPLDRMFEFNYFRPVYIVEGIQAAQGNPAITHVPSREGDPERVVFLTREPLRPQRTISFEAGIKHNFPDILVIEVTGFFKSFTNQTLPRNGIFDRRVYGYDPFTRATTANVFYTSSFPGDYGDARGFEITLRTLFSSFATFDVNYSFSRATQGRATPGRVDLDSVGTPRYTWDIEVNKRIPIETNFSRPHIVRVNAFLRYPDQVGDSFLSLLLRGTTASILYRFTSGQTFTYLGPEDPPDTYDNQRYPASHTVDLRVDKMFRLFDTGELTVYARITNLLNAKNVRSIGDIYFDPNAVKKYVETGEVSTVDGAGYDISWQTWYETRRVYLGMRYTF